jgi:hypothetical protein
VSRRLDNYRTQLQQDIRAHRRRLTFLRGHPSQCRVILLLPVALPQAVRAGRDSPSEKRPNGGCGGVTNVSP